MREIAGPTQEDLAERNKDNYATCVNDMYAEIVSGENNFFISCPSYKNSHNSIEEHIRTFSNNKSQLIVIYSFDDEKFETAKEIFDKGYERVTEKYSTRCTLTASNDIKGDIIPIGDIETYRFYGNHIILDKEGKEIGAYTYGYAFIYNDIPCIISGILFAGDTDSRETQGLMTILNDMMRSVRPNKYFFLKKEI